MIPTKYLLAIIHSFLFISSLAILITAGGFQSALSDNYLLFLKSVDAVLMYVIIFGVCLLLTAVVTLISVYYQNTKLESLYYCGMSIFMFIEFCMILTLLIQKAEAMAKVEQALRSTEPTYVQNRIASATWNSLQRDLECCGLHKPDEWLLVFGNSSIPDSCCSVYSAGCGKSAVKTQNFHHAGCLNGVTVWARDVQIFVGVVFPFLLILQLFSIPLVRRFQRTLH